MPTLRRRSASMMGRHVITLLSFVLALLCCKRTDAFVKNTRRTNIHIYPGQQQHQHQQKLVAEPRQQQPHSAAVNVNVNRLAHGNSGDAHTRSPSLSTIIRQASTSTDASSLTSEDEESSAPLEESSSSASPSSPHIPSTKLTGSKLRQLKDIMWVRETTEDLTAAEFACTVEQEQTEADSGVAAEDAEANDDENDENEDKPVLQRKRRRAVDYEKLLNQLNRRIRDMGCGGDLSTYTEGVEETSFECYLQQGEGMGRWVLTDKQRQALLSRISRTRQLLVQVIRGRVLEQEEIDTMQFSIALPEIRMEIPKEDDPTSIGPKLYVRDDGTVDWDGALQDQAALGKFGTAVWARINGRDPESIDADTVVEGGIEHKPKAVMAKIEDTQQIKEARERLGMLSEELSQMERAHTALLSSAISAGQAVANVNLATLGPALRSNIRESIEAIDKMKEEVSLQTLIYELERIYTYLVGELGNPALNGYIPLQDRLNVAEFGLLESQIDSFNRLLEAGEYVDADVLSVVMDQLTDFKRRLGIDYYVTGLSFDREAITRWLGELTVEAKKGLAFYVKGVQLFWNDLVFCLSLINRAAQGYTLKPREVRTIR
jgi:hypothetical protein